MIKPTEMGEKVTFYEQLEEDVGPVILINKFNVKPGEMDQFLKAWVSVAEIIKQQPGFICTQLHRGIASSCAFINYNVWESTAQLKRALNNPEFQSHAEKYPVNTVISPHLFKKVAVPEICVD
jgi:quinol monooxygenase YgiN